MIRVRCALADDPRLDALDRACFPDDAPYPKRARGCSWWLALDADGAAVAFAGMRVLRDVTFLCRAGVMPLARGGHLHRRLIRVRLRAAPAEMPIVTYTIAGNVVSANNLIACGMRLWTPRNAWAGRDVLYWRREARR